MRKSETETISSLYPFLHQVESKIRRSTKCIPCLSLRTVRSNSYNEEQDVEHHETFRDGSNFYYASTLSSRRLLTALLQDAGSSRRAADVEAEMRRLAKIGSRPPEKGRPEPDPEPQHLKTHASGLIPLDASRNLSEQMTLVERAVLRYLDTPDAMFLTSGSTSRSMSPKASQARRLTRLQKTCRSSVVKQGSRTKNAQRI